MKTLFTLSEHTDWIRKMKFTKQSIISASYDSTVKVWDLKTGLCKKNLVGHRGSVNCFHYDEEKVSHVPLLIISFPLFREELIDLFYPCFYDLEYDYYWIVR